MRRLSRKIFLASLLVAHGLLLWLMLQLYWQWYDWLKGYSVQGLIFCWLLSHGLASLCAPAFMQGAETKEDYEAAGPLELIKLFHLTLAITFVALCVVFLGLWCFGWLWVGVEQIAAWLRDAVFGF